MARFLILFLLTVAVGCWGLEPVSFDAMDWDVDGVVNWSWIDGELHNLSGGGYVTSRTECTYPNSASIVLYPQENASKASEASLVLRDRKGSAWHLSLVDDGKEHLVALTLRRNRKNVKLEVNFEAGQDFRWDYKQHYLLSLDLNNGKAIGSISDLEGKTLCRVVADAGEKNQFPTRLAVHATTLHCAYREPKASSVQYIKSDYVIPPQRFTAKHQYTSPRNVSKEFSGKATGFFHVEQDPSGRSWIIDPNGKAMFLCGVDMLTYSGRHCEVLGYSPYKRNMDKLFNGNVERWAEHTMERLVQWGFNFSGTCSPEFNTKIAFSKNLMLGSAFAAFGDEYNLAPYRGRVGTAMPNPFHPRFAEWCKRRFLLLLGMEISNPYFVGYCSDNEMLWNGTSHNRDGSGLFDDTLAKPSSHSAKQALIKFLAERYQNNIAKFNQEWNQQLKDFNELGNIKKLVHHNDSQLLVKQDFLTLVAETYFSTVRSVIRELDPNHMYMGCRYAGCSSAHERVWRATGKYCDVVTFNQYPMANTRLGRISVGGKDMVDAFSQIHRWTNRPLLITEWAFLGLDSGLPCEHGAGQRLATQKERAEHAELFVRMNASQPFMVGLNWYKHGDDPKLGVRKNFPENSNYGLVNEMDEPYPELTSMFARIQADVDELRRTVPEKKEFPHGGALYRKLSSPGHASPALKLEKHAMDNGTIRVEYQPREEKIYYYRNGEKLGTISYMLGYYVADGGRDWQSAQRFTNLKLESTAGGAAMSFVASAKLKHGGEYRIEGRLLLASQGDQLITEVRSLKNDSTLPLSLNGIYLPVFPAFDPSKANTKSSRFVSNSEVWTRDDGTYYGLATEVSPIQIKFFRDKIGFHADAKYPIDLPLKAGEWFKFSEPCYAFVISGKGDRTKQVGELLLADLD